MALLVIKQSKGCKFMPKMHQNAFGGRALPGPAGEANKLRRLPSRNGAATSKGRELGGQSMYRVRRKIDASHRILSQVGVLPSGWRVY